MSFYTQLTFAQEASNTPLGFDKRNYYNIFYEVSDFEVDMVRRVRINGILNVKGKDFLVITGATTGNRNVATGYILFSSIKAILANGHIEPERSFSKETARN